MDPITLPILYGRSANKNDIPKTFQKIQRQKASKHTYILKTLTGSFAERAEEIAKKHDNDEDPI